MAQTYIPSEKEAEVRSQVYGDFRKMRELKEKSFPHFSGPRGERSFLDYIEDSERILNGYTLSREEQGKEDWQSNMMDNVSRAKLRALAAGSGLKYPEMKIQATNAGGLRSRVHADLMKGALKQSYRDTNPTLQSFLESWMMYSHGVVFEYEGYKTGGCKQLRVVSFDSLTGDVETKSEYVKFGGKPYNVLLNPQEFYWWDMFVLNVQEQRRLIWVQHFSKKELEMEFSKFPKYKLVMDRKEAGASLEAQETLFYKDWMDRVDVEDDFEILRYYSVEEDRYEIWVNGVPLLRAPMLWGDKRKIYPFAKSIVEPFANPIFFVGMSFGHIMEAYQETKNTNINSLVDKIYRGADPGWLIGLGNKDLFDVEAQFEGSDGRYYVPDVAQVKPIPYSQVNQGELAMLQILDRGLDTLSVDKTQQGMQSAGRRTARDAVLADQRAQEVKGIAFMFLEDLWWQKTRLRIRIILSHWLKDKAAQEKMRDQIITISDFMFPDGSSGMLDIHVAKTRSKLMSVEDITAREQTMKRQGVDNYKLISILYSFLDDWDYEIEIVPQSVYNRDKAAQSLEVKEKIQDSAILFPEYFAANKKKYFSDLVGIYGETPEDYQEPPPPQPPQGAPGMGAGGPGGPGGGSPTDQGMAALMGGGTPTATPTQ